MRKALILSLMLSAACAAALPALPAPPPDDPRKILDELIRLTQGGFSDQTILTFLRARRAGLPPVLTAQDFASLRKSGVPETVIGYLAGATAIELDTGGRTAAMDAEPAKEPTYPEPPYSYLPPYAGGYVGSPFFLRHHLHRHHPPLPAQPGFPRIGPNGFPILASPNAPGGMPPPIGPNGFPVLGSLPGTP